jgi:hypothetical protein
LNEANRSIEDNTLKMESETEKVEELETDLRREEKVLEDIMDSIKGK